MRLSDVTRADQDTRPNTVVVAFRGDFKAASEERDIWISWTEGWPFPEDNEWYVELGTGPQELDYAKVNLKNVIVLDKKYLQAQHAERLAKVKERNKLIRPRRAKPSERIFDKEIVALDPFDPNRTKVVGISGHRSRQAGRGKYRFILLTPHKAGTVTAKVWSFPEHKEAWAFSRMLFQKYGIWRYHANTAAEASDSPYTEGDSRSPNTRPKTAIGWSEDRPGVLGVFYAIGPDKDHYPNMAVAARALGYDIFVGNLAQSI